MSPKHYVTNNKNEMLDEQDFKNHNCNPSSLFFKFAVLFKPLFHVLSSYFHVSLSRVAVSIV